MEADLTAFDQCHTIEAIQARLQRLAQDLFVIMRGASAEIPTSIDLRMLSELSYADLKQCHRPVCLLSEICRLLLKFGAPHALRQCVALAHAIYPFQCKRNESRYLSALYKGMAQIGLGATDLGIKNVALGLTGHDHFPMLAVDRALGAWALMSAAIANRNLKLALTFVEQWAAAAQEGGLAGEHWRANLARWLLRLVFGEQTPDLQDLPTQTPAPQAAWQPIVNLLLEWTTTLQTGRCAEMPVIAEPLPLFLGVVWHDGSPGAAFPENEGNGDFGALCALRRKYCHPHLTRTLATEEISAYANLMAQWELPRPLCECETILKERHPDAYFQCNLTRLLGEPILRKVLRETPLDPAIVRQDQAIILVTDVRQFSALSEQRNPEAIFDVLNPVFKILSEELEPVGGVILEFVGDSIILVFNTFPGQQADLFTILRQTIRGLRRIYILNAMSRQTRQPDIRIGVGINQGPVALGYLGGLARCHLTVLGNTVNLAARLESASKELPGDVIISAACFDQLSAAIWATPQQVNFTLRDLGVHTMKNIAAPVHLFGFSPLVQYWVDFTPMGFVARPEPGIVYLDTGNADEPGIIDHHFERQPANSACELLVRRPTLLLKHVKGLKPSQIEFRVHTAPDLDCAAALYAAQELLRPRPRKPLLRKLAKYVSQVDQAHIPRPERITESLYGVFRAHQLLVSKQAGAAVTDLHLLEAGLRVIDAALYLLAEHPQDRDFATIFHDRPDWFPEEQRLLRDDFAHYQEDVNRRSHVYQASVNGLAEPVTGLWLDHPQSLFFRIWAWNDPNAPGGRGYPLIAVDLSEPGKTRFLIGVDPARGLHLNGLGQLLEQYETRKRQQLGKERPVTPIRHPADNSDPWYFGQGHNYAVIDAPGEGTLLTAAEVQQIHESWQPPT